MVLYLAQVGSVKSIMPSLAAIHNRLPNKDNLVRRGVIVQDSNKCKGGCDMVETDSLLFFECPIFAGLWYHVIRWFGLLSVLPTDGWEHFDQFGALVANVRSTVLRVRTIWFTCICIIWKARNTFIFKNKATIVDQMFKEVQRLSWFWLSNEHKSL